mmetsp:Transcript_1603/g.5141  ORF Transcript_1603/g.5141 Transcript_1603/m.5141 type:complete len:124 (+) Transcript_1603:83-454(+)
MNALTMLYCSTCRRARSSRFFAPVSSTKTCKPCLLRHRERQRRRRSPRDLRIQGLGRCRSASADVLREKKKCSTCKCFKAGCAFRSKNQTCESCLFKRRIRVALGDFKADEDSDLLISDMTST